VSLNADNFLEEYRKQIIRQAVKDLFGKINLMVETSLSVLDGKVPTSPMPSSGKKVNLDEWEEVLEKPRPKKAVKVGRKKPRPQRLCPIEGCKSSFAPRYGGFCKKHRSTAASKLWRKQTRARRAK